MIIALDTETYKFNKEKEVYEPSLDARDFVLGCIKIDKKKKPLWFTSPEEMFDFLLDFIDKRKKEGHNCYIYAHNHSYDLYAYAKNRINDVEILKVKQQKPLFALLNETGLLLDTLSFYKCPLKKVGKLVGLPKLEMPDEVKDLSELKEYLLRDVEIVMESIKMLRDVLKGLSHRPKKMLTAGSLAMNYFKTHCKREDFEGIPYSAYLYRKGTIHQTKYNKFIRRALRGGRCECFRQDKFKKVSMIDINSLYPFVMAEIMKIPDILKERRHYNIQGMIPDEEILGKIGVVKAKVKFPKKKMGYLPTKNARTGKGIFFPCNGEVVTGYWTTMEINNAIKEGYEVLEIYEAVLYGELPFNPFTKLMRGLYDLRKKSQEEMGYVIKLLMNSLAGKFAQYRGDTERAVCHRQDILEYEKSGFEIQSDLGEEYFLSKEGEKKVPPYAHPIFTILINAYARDYLYWQMKKIPFEDLVYCDTDAIAFVGDHLDKYDIGDKLGEFKTVFENEAGEFIKEKDYRFTDKEGEILKVVCAGSTNRELTQGQSWGEEEIVNKKMYTYNMGCKTGNFDKVGSFFDVHTKINPLKRKREMKFPPQFEEFTPEDLKSFSEED
ncbi:MAG: DNA polymerase [Candidatus Pacearchaeota archaeon]